jgi:hypothetical protein
MVRRFRAGLLHRGRIRFEQLDVERLDVADEVGNLVEDADEVEPRESGEGRER